MQRDNDGRGYLVTMTAVDGALCDGDGGGRYQATMTKNVIWWWQQWRVFHDSKEDATVNCVMVFGNCGCA